MKKLTTTQKKVLTAAAKQPKLPIQEHMGRIKGGTAVHRQIAYSLLKEGYVTEDGDYHYITDEGIAAVGAKAAKAKPAKAEKKGKQKPAKEAKAKKPAKGKAAKKSAAAEPEAQTEQQTDADTTTPAEAPAAGEGKPAKGRQLLINMLSRDEGATRPQMVAATGWQDGAISGTMSKIKKLLAPQGKQIVSSKDAAGTLVYRITEAQAA